MREKSKRSIVAGVVFTLAATSVAHLAVAEPPIEGRVATPVGNVEAGAQDDADNSERNVRDRGGDRVTPTDQSNAPADIEMTRKIRQGITSNGAMSMQARNVKIVTQGGVVTLRGPVKTLQEKTAIESLAKDAGAARIDNQLEIDGD